MLAMVRNGMKRVVLKEEGVEIELEKEGSGPNVQYISTQREAPFHPHPTLPSASHDAKPSPQPAVEAKESKFITSPMVGTFYAAPSPDDPSYVKVGAQIEEGTVVCIIEAMKVMNEVKAGQKGIVAEILLKNGDPVEFGTKMIRIT